MKREEILKPRPCPRCGQHMSAKLLFSRHFMRGRKISHAHKARKKMGIGRVNKIEIIRQWSVGISVPKIHANTGHSTSTIYKILREHR